MRLLAAAAILMTIIGAPSAHAKGKLAGNAGGNEREVAVYSAARGLVEWTITGPSGQYEFTLDPGEYMVSCGGRLAPYVRIRDGETTRLSYADVPNVDMQSEMWTPSCISFGQTYTATGTAFNGVGFWMPGGETRLKLSIREKGPEGRLIGEITTDEKKTWITGAGMGSVHCPTTPGEVYYVELASVEGVRWSIATPKGPDPYEGGIAYFDGVAHPETDLGISVKESRPGLVSVAAARNDQHFISEGPGSGSCRVAAQTFVARHGKNILTIGANCGFGGGIQDFLFSLREGSPDGRELFSKRARMVSDWGTTVYLLPNEVLLKEGQQYYFEYRRADGEPFYSYLSSDTYAEGKAYRDGKEVEGFDQLFHVTGEVEPGGITYPYNMLITDVTDTSARVSWETGTPADGEVLYGDDLALRNRVSAGDALTTEHAAVLTDLQPGTVYYVRVTSSTRKEGSSKAYGRVESFMTEPSGDDLPRFIRPEPAPPEAKPGPGSVPLVNGGFEDGLTGWSRCSMAEPKSPSADYPVGSGPFGSPTPGIDGYGPRAGRSMYGWRYLAVDDPNPEVPREDWKHEIIYQRISVIPGKSYVLKAWAITGDRGSGWGRDSRIRLVADPTDSGILESPKTASDAIATQWFALENLWRPISLPFTAKADHAVVGVHFLQWWALEASYLFVDSVSVEEAGASRP